MRKLTYLVAATIDGHITGPDNGNPDFFLYAGDHMDELRTEYPEALPTQARDFFGVADTPAKHFDTVLQGRSTWELGAREGMTNTYRHLRNIVFSRSITESPDPTVEFVATDPVAKVRELKAEPGMGIWLCGGGGSRPCCGRRSTRSSSSCTRSWPGPGFRCSRATSRRRHTSWWMSSSLTAGLCT
ncbi:hypothetical protein GCM10029964_028480 [Kibdelosporangium lantanae]